MNYSSKFNFAKFSEVLPFYITEIDDKFFTSLNNHPNKTFVQKILPKLTSNLNDEEMQEFKDLESLTKAEKIRLMLNLALKKMVTKTGSSTQPLFASTTNHQQEQFYIHYMDEYLPINNDDPQIERRYNFYIKINPESYLYKYLEQIQLSFYLDEDNKILSGGFSFNYTPCLQAEVSFQETTRQIYLHNLIRNFILKQLYPLSLENILELVEDYQPYKRKPSKLTKRKKTQLEFNYITIDDIQANWVDLITKKYLRYHNYDQVEHDYYCDQLFYSILTTTIIALSLSEELKIYFTSQTPQLILGLLNKVSEVSTMKTANAAHDFVMLAKHLNTEYFAKKPKADIKRIKTTQEIIEWVAVAQAKRGLESFGYPVSICQIYDQENQILISPDTIFRDHDALKIIYLLIIAPELFGMDEDSPHFIEYGQFLTIIKNHQFDAHSMPQFYQRVNESNCELNYNFATFLNDKAVLMLTNAADVFLYHDYYWALIYAQSINWIRQDIEFDFDHDLEPKKNALLYQDKINTLENLIFDWHDDFYGIPQIKNIVYKLDQINNVKASIRLLIDRISEKDHIYKKDGERAILIYAFLVAGLIGFNNFFGMVFTILSVSDHPNLTATNLIVIGFAILLNVLLIVTMITYFVKAYKQRKFIKENKAN